MSYQILPPTTAGIYPEKFADEKFLKLNRTTTIILLLILLALGFALRVGNLGAESLSEDELNKLQTVADYRANGLSGRNGEHPFLMKGLQTVSLIVSEKINDSFFSADSDKRISDEFALRFPTALFGTFTVLLLFLLLSELFGTNIALIAAALWAVDPNAIGFDRIAKEDSFLLFFFLLANVFWTRAQSAAERGDEKWQRYAWATAASFGAMMASKYLPHLIAISAAYNKIFQEIPAINWKFNRYAWLRFFIVMGVAFLIFNPTILFPDTWREMLTFSGEKRIGHDSYEYMNALYQNKVTAWLAGVPWSFYYVFIAVKTPLITLLFFLIGLTQAFRKKLGDGRYFIFFWAFMWFMPFTVLGGKFTRYFTVAQPLILIIAAIGFYYAARWITQKVSNDFSNKTAANFVSAILFLVLIAPSIWSSISVSPHFRLHTNLLGGGTTNAGSYFPHDEFYDTSTRDITALIAKQARQNALVAVETPILFEHYAKKIGREDLQFISLSDRTQTVRLSSGDFIVAAKGRRYFSNSAILEYLKNSVQPLGETKVGEVVSAEIYQLDENSANRIRELSEQKTFQ